jgi:RNA polymerase sigma-70 factor (ECF subfamily)
MTQEEQMIADVLAGKADAFRELLGRYQRPVLRMICNLIGDPHTAEDLTQEVFLTVYRKLPTFDPIRCRFSTWLFTISRNRCISFLRRNKKTYLTDRPEVSFSEDLSEPICREEFLEQMDQVLNQLPPHQKRAFILAEFEDLPYEEIAQIECVSIGTVKSRIHRAKEKLRKALQRISGDQS